MGTTDCQVLSTGLRVELWMGFPAGGWGGEPVGIGFVVRRHAGVSCGRRQQTRTGSCRLFLWVVWAESQKSCWKSPTAPRNKCKPLQGNLFRKFRAVVMGQGHINTLKETPPIPSQERVGETKQVEKVDMRTDGQKTCTVSPRPPIPATYAHVVRRETNLVRRLLKWDEPCSSHF